MLPPFEEALADLIDRYAEGPPGWREEIISALEMQLMAQREQERADESR